MTGDPLSRRSFLQGISAAGGGLTLAFAIPFALARAAEEAPEVTAWLVISPDNSVVIRVARSEMGQGAQTGLAMLVAEELECDWAKVRTEFVAPEENWRRDRVWGDLSTGASRSIASSQLYLRQAGAIARHMLIAAAAARWNVAASECVAHMSAIIHRPTGRTVTFGAVAADAAKLTPPAAVELKEPDTWKLAGKPRRRLDVLDKVTAQPIYAIDVRLPGMLYAAILHCPVFGGRLKSVDESAIAAMPGIRRVVHLPDAVAVVADSWWRARRGIKTLPVVWDERGNGRMASADIFQTVRCGLDAEGSQVGRADGDVAAGLAGAARRIEPAAPGLNDVGARHAAVAALVPDHRQRLDRAPRAPPGIGDDRNRVGQPHHAADTRHRGNSAFVDRFQSAAEYRAMQDGGVKHARQPHVDRIDRLRRNFVEHVKAPPRLARELPGVRLLQLDRSRGRELGRILGDGAECQRAAGRPVRDRTHVRDAFRRRHIPARRGRSDQHVPGDGAGLPQVKLRGRDRTAGAGR